jgi:hypothetical protein
MSVNARMSQSDQRLYSPNRDLAHCFGDVMKEVAASCEDGKWDALVDLARANKVTDEQVGEGCAALLYFIYSQSDQRESMAQGLARCGFLDLDPVVRVILMAHLGKVILGMHWAGVKEATLGGVGPAQTYRDLRFAGRHCARLMEMPRWKRRARLWWYRVKQAWAALSGRRDR